MISEIDLIRSVESMISPRERYEREQFWELAEDIVSIDTESIYGQNNGTLARVFLRLKLKTD